jgi:exodeoxyribonuclease V gamma subunit
VIRFCCSNRLEALVEALADTVGVGRTSLFDPLTLVVPNTLVEGYVKQGLARRLGIAAHVETGFLRGFLRKVAAASAPDTVIVDKDLLEGALLELLHDPGWLGGPELRPVREYLGGDGGALDADARDRKRVQLAAELAGLFDEYAFSRPEMLAAWREGALVSEADPASQRWQREVWLALQGSGGLFARRGAVTLPDFLARTPVEALRPPPAVHLFGISYVARLYGAIFQTLGRATDVFVYALAPARATTSGAEALAPEPSPIDLWARPGRENAQLLARLAGGSVDARFVDPAAGARAPLLAAVQKAALDRAPVARRKRAPGSARRSTGAGSLDDSLTVVPATDPRRELETIAAEIWARVRGDQALTFADFAVVVPQASAAVYLPLAQAVFDEASELPHTIVDLPRAAERRILDVVALLLELPLGSLGRPDLLRVAMHPAVARRFPEVDPEDWLALCEALEIVRGADRASEPPSYLERDRTSWEQGLRRLALGAFLSGPRAGEESPFVLGGEAMLAFDLPPDLEPAARALGMAARALIAFAHAARGAPAPFAAHAALLRRIIAETVLPEPGDEEAALGDALRVLETVEAGLPAALPISYRVAAELIKARLSATVRRHRAPEGVTVASFVPMRALPFRHIFVAGLDERAFPAPESVRALDLRAGTRHPGDVSPREQDEHMFLETLLAARERITLSYVARDPVTGEEKSPSSVVRALLELLEPERAAEDASTIVRTRPPLARHEDAAACAVIPGAARERRAAALGASLRRANGGVLKLPPLGSLTPMLSPEARRGVTSDLDWVSPPIAQAVSRPRRGLTLTDLRHFLECPLQASARVLLPIGDDDDAAAEAEAAIREHEPLDEARRNTLSFLHQVMAQALTPGEQTGTDALAAIYDREARQKTLEGVLPDGLFARALRERHLGLLGCWQTGVLDLTGGLLREPAPLFLGAAPEHRRDAIIVPAPTVSLTDGSSMTIGGRTSLVAAAANDGARVVISLLRSTHQNNLERDLLAPFFTHLALAALDDDARPTRAIVVRPNKDGSPEAEARLLRPVTQTQAREYLGALASELVRDVHPYFLPCEAVLHWKKSASKPDARGVRDSVLMLRDDNWTHFLSDYGPIPGPKDYPVPSEQVATEIVTRRFGLFFAVTAPGISAGEEEPS